MRIGLLAAIALAACARPVLEPRAWNDAPPDAPCTVDVLYHDGMGDARSSLRYDAAGHVVFGTTRLTYSGRGWERITWDGDRPVAFDTYYEDAGQPDFCDEGCGEPASRRIDHVTLRYDGDHVVALDRHAQMYANDGERWVRVEHPHGKQRYHYAHGHLVEIDAGLASLQGSVNGTARLAYDGDHVVRRTFGHLTSTYAWKDGHLATYRWMHYVDTYRYDDAGRLVGDDLAGTDGDDVTSTWTYDDRGRLIEKVKDENVWTWTYDDDGRVIHETNGGSTTDLTYHGACPANLGAPPPPDPLVLSGAGACVTSPGYVYNTCGF